jgi:DNA-binding transcriptional regulator/RsmH inhibitor MraZ
MGPEGPAPAPSLPTDRPPRQATALPDFGERLGSLIDDSIAKYSADAAQLGGSPTVATARSALLSQITRAATPTCRRQLKLLQVQSRERFMQKLAALKPSLKVEAELRTMVKEAATKFEADAKAALPPTLPLSYSFEKQAVVTSMAEAAKAQVELWRVQGLYLPLDGFKTPVDIGLHWLLPRPFGVDSRYDSISSRDKPKFRPRAAPMKVRAMDGYKARGLQDPKDMVFDAKMS